MNVAGLPSAIPCSISFTVAAWVDTDDAAAFRVVGLVDVHVDRHVVLVREFQADIGVFLPFPVTPFVVRHPADHVRDIRTRVPGGPHPLEWFQPADTVHVDVGPELCAAVSDVVANRGFRSLPDVLDGVLGLALVDVLYRFRERAGRTRLWAASPR